MSYKEALDWACRQLSLISSSPLLEAERLLLHVTKAPETSWLYAHGNEELPENAYTTFSELVADRKSGKPLGYILGSWDFYGRTFFVNDNVLLPRPETEGLVDGALRAIREISRYQDRPVTVAEIGVGSGCVSITLLLELERQFSMSPFRVEMIATDISEQALAVAQANAKTYDVFDHIDFIQGDMLQPIQNRMVDLIVSNPPYVPKEELAVAADSPDTVGLTFEPHEALDGGADGLTYVRAITSSGIPYVIETVGGVIETSDLQKDPA